MSGWAPMTVHPPSGLSGEALEKVEEGIEEYLQEEYGEEDPWLIAAHDQLEQRDDELSQKYFEAIDE